VLAEINRRKAGKTLLRPGMKSEEPDEGTLLRAASPELPITSPEELMRAAEPSSTAHQPPPQSLLARLMKRLR
jgi:hypothetical protein